MKLGEHDPFRDMSSWDAELAASWVAALTLRAAGADQTRLRALIIELAELAAGDQVVELGCGAGALLAELASKVGPTGRVTGCDPLPELAAAATAGLAQAGLDQQAAVRVGGLERIAADRASLSAAIEQTVFIHLPEEQIVQALAAGIEMLKIGGRWISADQDGDTWIIDHPDRELTRRIIAFNSDYRYADGWTGRRLQRLLGAAGFDPVRVVVFPHVDTEPGSYLHGMALRIAGSARDEGVLSPAEHDRWVEQLGSWGGVEHFYSSINYYVAVGIRPGPAA